MAELTPYQQLREANPGKGRSKQYSTEVAAERKADKARRYVAAQARADTVLRTKYHDEWTDIFRLEQAGIDRERGPLPGDD